MTPGRRRAIAERAALLRQLRRHRVRLAGLSGLALAAGLAESVVLVVIVHAAVAISANRVGSVAAGPFHLEELSVSMLLLVAAVATLVRLAVALGAAWLGARITADVQRDMRVAVFDAYIDADWAGQSREREGGLQQIVGVEIDRAAMAMLTVSTGLSAACSLVMLMAVALTLNPVAAIALVVAVGALFLGFRPLTVRVRRQATARSLDELDVAEALNELVRMAEEIRVHGVGAEQKRRIGRVTSSVAGWFARLQFSTAAIPNLYQAAALLLVVVALLVVHEVGAASAAGSGALVLILLRAFTYSQQVQHAYHQLGERMAAVAAVEERLALYRAHAARAGGMELAGIDRLELVGVSYSYRPGEPAIDGLSFAVDRGEVIGVVGPSGAGKSTLVQLLLRLRLPDEGRYLVNGSDAAGFADDDWARLVSFLPQKPKLLAGTVADNIRFLREATEDQIEAAAMLAHLHHEIVSWPQGYETVIGERADALSGGQAQRLCLARALLTQPALLVLDEPTSALDAVSEHHIQLALEGLKGRTTVFLIAHRLSTLNICDRIMVLKAGRLEAMESRENLADVEGFYRDALRLSGLT